MGIQDIETSVLDEKVAKLVDELKEITPKLSPLLEKWARIRREIQVIMEELEKRKDVNKENSKE